jgi:hypothetical protein
MKAAITAVNEMQRAEETCKKQSEISVSGHGFKAGWLELRRKMIFTNQKNWVSN